MPVCPSGGHCTVQDPAFLGSLSRLCPSGCEGSLFPFFASAMCLSSILSGVLGVGLAYSISVSSGDYSA